MSVEFATDYKTDTLRMLRRLAGITAGCVPDLGGRRAVEYAGAVFALVAGMWPHARPSAVLVQAIDAVDYLSVSKDFQGTLAEALANQLVGVLTRTAE